MECNEIKEMQRFAKKLKIKCKIILLKTLENGLNKSYFMTYHTPQPKFD